MTDSLIRRMIIFGGLIIIGIISTQSYLLIRTWDLKDQEFDLTARKVLLKTAQRIANFNKSKLPKKHLIQRTSSNIYAVNINSGIDANILEDYLYQEMSSHSLKTDFEYSVFDCTSKDMVYGNYCSLENPEKETIRNNTLPTFTDLDYYFVVQFPSRENYLITNMRTTVLISVIAILSVLFFLYTIWVVMRQKKVSELQKDFINNMTHEFKTPISSIKIASDVLANNTSISKDDRLAKYTSIIADQNNRLNDQVEKVLNIARLEKDNFKLNKESIDLHQSIKKIALSETMRLTDGKIEMDLIQGSPEILADPLHFTNVVTNIIDNAIKYSGSSPDILISTMREKDTIVLSVKDQGIGIEKDKQRNIFNKFYRVSTGNVHDVKGFGLGLFYVKNICSSHGWTVDVDSELSKGTTFSIRIPLEKNKL